MTLSKEDALRAYAAMINTRDITKLSGLLIDEFHYASMWVLLEMKSREEYVDYMTHKFETIKKSDDGAVWAEMAISEREFPLGPCVVLAQGDKSNLVALVIAKIGENKIIRLDMCCVPSPYSVRRTGDYPV